MIFKIILGLPRRNTSERGLKDNTTWVSGSMVSWCLVAGTCSLGDRGGVRGRRYSGSPPSHSLPVPDTPSKNSELFKIRKITQDNLIPFNEK